MKISTLICFVCLVASCCEAIEKPRKLALLVAATKGWPFYRQQSTLYSMYRTLVEGGFNTKNIITMFYDDIANNANNIEKPVVRDKPFGRNVYKDIQKDYTGKDVNAKNLLAILEGNSTIASGPVFKSNRGDNLFVYITGYGAPQYITFPTGPGLTANDLMNAFKHLKKQQKIKKVLAVIESGHASQMFDGIIPRKDGIIGISSTLMNELPSPLHCNYQKRICYGTEFGYAFVQRLQITNNNGTKETIFDVFSRVREMTQHSQVKLFGHYELGSSLFQEFIERKPVSALSSGTNMFGNSVSTSSNSVVLNELDKGEIMSHAEQFERFHVVNEDEGAISQTDNYSTITMANLNKNRIIIKQTFKDIFEYLKKMGYTNLNYDESAKTNVLGETLSDQYTEAIENFSSACISVSKNPYVHSELWRFAYLVSNNVSLEDLDQAMSSACGEEHRIIENTH